MATSCTKTLLGVPQSSPLFWQHNVLEHTWMSELLHAFWCWYEEQRLYYIQASHNLVFCDQLPRPICHYWSTSFCDELHVMLVLSVALPLLGPVGLFTGIKFTRGKSCLANCQVSDKVYAAAAVNRLNACFCEGCCVLQGGKNC